jgi:CRISPR system Cascade subunit CasE
VDPQPGNSVVILVQSATQPDWDYAFHNARHLLAAPPQVKPFTPGFADGQQLRFRLVANPTFKRAGKRLAWLHEEDQVRWLARKGEQAGFRLLQALATPIGMNTGRKRDEHGDQSLSWFGVRFEGLLQVTDAEACHETLIRGLGPAKALGCGLLSVARPC